MKIALAQFNPTVGDFDGNSKRIIELSERAKAGRADLAVFSELCVCGYPPQDLLERPAFLERNHTQITALAKALPLPAIVGYVGKAEERTGKQATNSAGLLANGQVMFEQHKMLLPTYDVFDESRYFQPAQSQMVMPFNSQQLGLTICEDSWNDKNFWAQRLYDRDPVAELVGKGSTLLLNISASPYVMGKRELRHHMLSTLAREHGVPVIYVNQVGGNDSLIFDGASMAILPDGSVAAQAYSFKEDLVFFDTETGQGELRVQPSDEIESAYRALVLGTRDYVQKCGFQKAVVGLSGGVDSALVCTVAVDSLGAENVLGVAMPGPYSSEGSVRDAKALAVNLGIEFKCFKITDVFNCYRQVLREPFAKYPEDATEENLQARIRGNLLMALSNKLGHLVLSTGNKSELSVGYCTLYGDMAGGLAVISDVPKTLVYELARYRNRERELIPVESLNKAPSAELRAGQTDQDSLPPYDMLDVILRGYVEDLKSPAQIAEEGNFPIDLVREITTKVDRNEYKRKQAAPGLKITSKAFSVGRRLPLANRFSS